MSALPGWWRWESMVGAVVTDYGAGVRIVAVSKEHIHGAAVESSANEHGPVWMRLRKERCTSVDPADPATIGCLTARVREVCEDPRLYARPTADGTGWMIYSLVHGWAFYRPTEWSALMAAGDAAWARKPTTFPTTPQGHTP